jgi:hypothetical protein
MSHPSEHVVTSRDALHTMTVRDLETAITNAGVAMSRRQLLRHCKAGTFDAVTDSPKWIDGRYVLESSPPPKSMRRPDTNAPARVRPNRHRLALFCVCRHMTRPQPTGKTRTHGTRDSIPPGRTAPHAALAGARPRSRAVPAACCLQAHAPPACSTAGYRWESSPRDLVFGRGGFLCRFLLLSQGLAQHVQCARLYRA